MNIIRSEVGTTIKVTDLELNNQTIKKKFFPKIKKIFSVSFFYDPQFHFSRHLISSINSSLIDLEHSQTMATYTCKTCLVTSDEILKHLSQSRHKTVQYDPLEEVIECEDCGDSNIHLLQMLRYGLSDLSLLCTACYSKTAKDASAEYSLSNGSIFQKFPLYYKLRDIQCDNCNDENKLHVANGKTGQIILCKTCLESQPFPDMKFVSEGSPDFLYALLGLKEFIPKANAKNSSSKRKMGRRGGRERKPKVVDAEALKRKAHYENAKATSMALKTGKTVKAVGSSDTTPNISRLSTPGPQNKSSGVKSQRPSARDVKSTGTSKSKPGQASRNSKSPKAPKEGNSVKALNSERFAMSEKPTHVEKTSNMSEYSDKSKNGKRTPKAENSSKLEKPLHSEKSENSLKSDKVSRPQKNKPAKESMDKSKPQQNGKSKTTEKKREKTDSSREKLSKTSSSGKPEESKKEERSSTPQGKLKEAKPVESKTKSTQNTPDVPEIKLPPGVVKYQPSSSPKLTYDNMTEYFNEMCYNLFLEEKASLNTSGNAFLTSEDFVLEWYADQDKKHKMFKLEMVMTPEFLDRYVSKKMQALKKVPFAAGQSLILTLGDDIAWYGSIALSESHSGSSKKSGKGKSGKPQRGRKPMRASLGPSVLEVIVELHPWNTMPLPITVNVNQLKILPVSVPVSRVFTAMSRILNPKFIDLLEGKKPIKQIVFKNYLKFTRDSFNDSQKVAIQSVLNNAITVLQGPPGTGKTSTIYEIILQLLENLNTFPILVVAALNIAIDNIAEKLLDSHKQRILRIVSLEKEPEYNREHPLASICLHHKVFDGLPLQAQETLKEMRRPNSTVSQNQYKKLMTTQIDYLNKLIALARVIFTTTVVAGGNQLKLCPKIPVIIMDEATQSSEPTTLIPLSIPGVEKFVFVGDQKQLSSFSQVPNLSLSLFERIILNGTYKTPHMLDTQYRMHPAISEFPRHRFYGGLLKDGLTPADRAMDGIPANPVVFWDTNGKCPEKIVNSRFWEDGGRTFANGGEISYLEKVLSMLIYDKGIQRSDIGVITPYRGQRDLISSSLVKNDLINPEKDEIHVEIDRDDFFNESKPVTIHSVADIMIASVDAFQGREKNFLVMSCVRSNAEKKIGFLSDARRMNVALTRAKYGLILVGDVDCLRGSDDLWKEYIDHLEERGSLLRSADFIY